VVAHQGDVFPEATYLGGALESRGSSQGAVGIADHEHPLRHVIGINAK
jgi:hypothetical protein